MTLFDPDAPTINHAWLRNNATEPEVEAAHTVANVTGSRYRLMVVSVHNNHPEGLTDDAVAELCNEPNMPPPRAASRRGELAKWGWLEPLLEDGKKVTRPTRTGHKAQVWVLTDDAKRLIRFSGVPGL